MKRRERHAPGADYLLDEFKIASTREIGLSGLGGNDKPQRVGIEICGEPRWVLNRRC